MIKRFSYSGPISGMTLPGGKHVVLHPGAELELDADLAFVKSLVTRKHLTEVASAPKSKRPAPADAPKSAAPPKSKRAAAGTPPTQRTPKIDNKTDAGPKDKGN